MREPLPRDVRANDSRSAPLGLVWTCLVMLAVVAVVRIEFSVRDPAQLDGPTTQTTGSTAAAPPSGYLVSGMPQP